MGSTVSPGPTLWSPAHPDACEVLARRPSACSAFADHGLVHRDIKPSNLMLASDGW